MSRIAQNIRSPNVTNKSSKCLIFPIFPFIFLVNPLCISDVELEFLNEVEAFGYSVIIIFHIQKWVDNSPPVWSIKRWTCETVWIVLFRPWNDTEPRNIHKPSIDLIASYIMSSYYGLQVLSLNLKRSRVSFSPYFLYKEVLFLERKVLYQKMMHFMTNKNWWKLVYIFDAIYWRFPA